MRTKYLFGVVTFIFIWIACLCVTFAQAKNLHNESLRGLKGVEVIVEDIKPEAERDGLTRNHVKVAVELEIRKAGIKILTREESLSMPGSPYLYVNVNLFKHKPGVYAFNIFIGCHQTVALLRNSSIITHAPTWTRRTVGMIAMPNLRDLYAFIKDDINIFINDYLTVNP